jgi:hypothetical protein
MPKTSTKLHPQENKFSIVTLLSYLNNNYRYSDTDQHITFKQYSESKTQTKSARVIINLEKCPGLKEFMSHYNEITSDANRSYTNSESTPEERAANSEYVQEDSNYGEVISLVSDMSLRGVLNLADTYTTISHAPDELDLYKIIVNSVIPQLGFPESKTINIDDYVRCINSFFNVPDKLKIKIYNTVFPHSTHDATKDTIGVNVVYLQHISKYHDDILSLVIEENKSQGEIYEFIQEHFADDIEFPETISEEVIERTRLQLRNPAIISQIIENQSSDTKWVSAMFAVESDDMVPGTVKLTTIEKNSIKSLIRELNIAKLFIDIISKGRIAEHTRYVEECRKYQLLKNKDSIAEIEEPTPERTMLDYLDEYRTIYNNTVEFYNANSNKISDMTPTDFITYLAKSIRFVMGNLCAHTSIYDAFTKEIETTGKLTVKELIKKVNEREENIGKTAFKMLMNDIKSKSNVVFKFSKSLRADLNNLISDDSYWTEQERADAKSREIAKSHSEEFETLHSSGSCSINNMDIYAKIGKYVDIPKIHKKYRVALGIHIVNYIQHQVEIIRARFYKKKEISIMIYS